MSAADRRAASAPHDEVRADVVARLEALRASGAGVVDPVALCVIDAMLRRLDRYDGTASAVLLSKVERRLRALSTRMTQTGVSMGEVPGEQSIAQARLDEQARAKGGLAALLAYLDEQLATPNPAASVAGGAETGSPVGSPELKSLRYFRRSWTRLSLEQQLARALAQAPDNAGPLNSHFLMLQALIRMRDGAPDYLEHFMTYAEALVWLDQADRGLSASTKTAARKASGKKADGVAVRRKGVKTTSDGNKA